MKYNDTTDFIKTTSRDYSIYVCQSRGIPAVSDGLKDSQRKALFVIKPMTEQIKTVSLAGSMLSSNTYLHGDASATEAISLMAAPYCNNICLLAGVGAFGTRVGPTDWGAPRYTYVKKNAYTESLIYQDYDIIPLKENYDGSVMEPKHFLPVIPLVLLNGVSGIAVGWSTEILPRAFKDIVYSTSPVKENLIK
jgi:DNA topoisomerase-2